MTSKPDTLSRFIDAASDRVARAIATVKADAAREKELRDAQFAVRMAELDARISSVSDIERRLADRLASLKDGEPGRDGTDGQNGRDGAPGKDGERGLDGEAGKDGAAGRDGQDGANGTDGRSVTIEEVEPLIRAEVERVLATWERPQDGKSANVEDVAPVIHEAIAAAIAALPLAKDGRDGVDGKDGAPGADGRDGIDGKDGEPGRDGVDGTHGRDGEAGKDGRDGLDGAPGKMPVAREWTDAVHYEGDIRTFEGGTYQATRDTGKAPGHEDWILLAGRGVDGKDGRSFTPRATYAESEVDTYRALDVVTVNGGSFYAKRDNPGPCPGDGWQLMASQGKQGKPGERGLPGQPGLRGLPGAPVIAADISSDGLLSLRNGDGSAVEVDLYPVLSQL